MNKTTSILIRGVSILGTIAAVCGLTGFEMDSVPHEGNMAAKWLVVASYNVIGFALFLLSAALVSKNQKDSQVVLALSITLKFAVAYYFYWLHSHGLIEDDVFALAEMANLAVLFVELGLRYLTKPGDESKAELRQVEEMYETVLAEKNRLQADLKGLKAELVTANQETERYLSKLETVNESLEEAQQTIQNQKKDIESYLAQAINAENEVNRLKKYEKCEGIVNKFISTYKSNQKLAPIYIYLNGGEPEILRFSGREDETLTTKTGVEITYEKGKSDIFYLS